jgi:hypothetical protein
MAHGSAENTSSRPRALLLYEVAAVDAWPLAGVADLEEFDSRILTGSTTIAPRVADVRMPLPRAARQGSIYETRWRSRTATSLRRARDGLMKGLAARLTGSGESPGSA